MDPFEIKINSLIDKKLSSMTNMETGNHAHNGYDVNQIDPAVGLLGFPVIQVPDATVIPTDVALNGTFRFYVDSTPQFRQWTFLNYMNPSGVIIGSWLSNTSGSTGTVTSVSVVTANGISGSVATSTTTPAITLTLGAITPSSVTTPTLAAATNTSVNINSGTYNTIQTYTPTAAGTATLDLSKGNIHHITMPAGNITIAISNGTAGQCFIIRILQDSSGSRTVTWFTTIRWANGGTAPTLTTTANKADTIGFEITGSNTYDGIPVMQNL